jgi:hypothetical protein
MNSGFSVDASVWITLIDRDATHANQKPRSHDTSRINWAKLLARVGEKFPLTGGRYGESIGCELLNLFVRPWVDGGRKRRPLKLERWAATRLKRVWRPN